MFSLICFMWNFEVTMEGYMCFLGSTVRLGQVVKWLLLMTCSKVFFTGIKRAAWYHLDSSGFLIAARALSAASSWLLGGHVGLLISLTCQNHGVVDLFPYSTVSPSLTKLRWLAAKAAMHPSSHSWPIDMRAPYCRWWKIWDVYFAWVKRGFRLSSDLWVACMMMPPGRMTWG